MRRAVAATRQAISPRLAIRILWNKSGSRGAIALAAVLPDRTARLLKQAAESTADTDGILVNVAVGYGGRREVVDAGGEKARAEEAVDPHSQDRRRGESAILMSLVIFFSVLEVRPSLPLTTVPSTIVLREKSLFFPSYDSSRMLSTEASGRNSSPCFCREPTAGIIRREKKRFFPRDN